MQITSSSALLYIVEFLIFRRCSLPRMPTHHAQEAVVPKEDDYYIPPTPATSTTRSSSDTPLQLSHRSSSAQLRRAAGSQSLEKLQECTKGWTASEIDKISQQDNSGSGKGPLHMAAWQGSLQNLHYLIHEVGCDPNVIATGTYCYGKTPIFFAATRGRNEIVQYLLQQVPNIQTRIVNNKGQSLLSIAASHLSTEVIQLVRKAEEREGTAPWVNYRQTHSDGLVYGDLDPRFLEREIRPDIDVVTEFAINPTTKESRMNSFLRKNPQHIKTDQKKASSAKSSSNRKSRLHAQREKERQELEEIWNQIDAATGESKIIVDEAILQRIIELSDKQNEEWIPSAAERLRNIPGTIQRLQLYATSLNAETRHAKLVTKLILATQGTEPRCSENTTATDKHPAHTNRISASLESPVWSIASQAVAHLKLSDFENGCKILSLQKMPLWVDTLDSLQLLKENLLLPSEIVVVGIDTEWYSDEDDQSQLATIQLAATSHFGQVTSFVIDVLVPDKLYQEECKSLVLRLFREKILLGFAVGHDLPVIENWIGERIDSRDKILDLQSLFHGKRQQVPGLAKCVSNFCETPLSKEEQCSNWLRRPLTTSQLSYAGLDAAILLALLSEAIRTGLVHKY